MRRAEAKPPARRSGQSKRTGASWQKAACRQARIFWHRQQTIGRCCKCNPWVAISGDQWPDDVRLSIEQRFTCQTCGTRELTSGRIFHWERKICAPFGNNLPSNANVK